MMLRDNIIRILIILVISSIYACSSEESLEIKAIRDFDIYANDTLNNVLVFDMVPTPNGFLIASVCGTSQLSNKFGGNGFFYLLEIDNFGNVLWEDVCATRLFESGYPSNLVSTETSNQFFVLWNEYNGQLKSIPITVGASPDSLDIQLIDCNGCRADKALNVDGSIFSIGLNEGVGGASTFITEIDIQGETTRLMSEKTFDASRLGGFGLSDINFLNRINNFLHLEANGQRLLFSGPTGPEMVLSHVGELIPEYASNDIWVADLFKNPEIEENFGVLLQNPDNPQGQSIFIPDLDLSGLPGESVIVDEINKQQYTFLSMDPDLPQFLIYYNFLRWVIVGTSIQGIPTIISINLENNQIVRSELGDNTRLNIAKAELKMGDLFIAGTTIVNNRFQRPFVLKIAKEDIF